MGKELQRHSTPKVLSVMANIVKLLNCCIVESQFSIYELATSRAPLIIIVILGPICHNMLKCSAIVQIAVQTEKLKPT